MLIFSTFPNFLLTFLSKYDIINLWGCLDGVYIKTYKDLQILVEKEVSEMSNSKDNNALEQVTGGVEAINGYYHDLHTIGGFKDEWTKSNSWDYDLLEMMKKKYGEDYTALAMNTFKTPAVMFGNKKPD